MNTYDVGDRPKLELSLAVGGVGTDPEALELRLTKPDGTVITRGWPTPDAAEFGHPSAGEFSSEFDATATGLYHYLWTSTGVGTTASESGSFRVRSGDFTSPDDGYPSLAALLDATVAPALLDAEPAVQLSLRRSAIATVEAFTGQRFAAEGTLLAPVTKLVTGSGNEKLFLPKRLSSLATLGISNSAIDHTGVALGSSTELPEGLNDYLYVDQGAAIGTWLTRALSDDRSLVFVAGVNNVSISGVWGWTEEEFPQAIADAIRLDMEDQASAAAHGLAGTITALRTLGSSGATQGPLSVTVDRATPLLSDRAMALVEPYSWSSSGIIL